MPIRGSLEFAPFEFVPSNNSEQRILSQHDLAKHVRYVDLAWRAFVIFLPIVGILVILMAIIVTTTTLKAIMREDERLATEARLVEMEDLAFQPD